MGDGPWRRFGNFDSFLFLVFSCLPGLSGVGNIHIVFYLLSQMLSFFTFKGNLHYFLQCEQFVFDYQSTAKITTSARR
jgi:hypothetical protein